MHRIGWSYSVFQYYCKIKKGFFPPAACITIFFQEHTDWGSISPNTSVLQAKDLQDVRLTRTRHLSQMEAFNKYWKGKNHELVKSKLHILPVMLIAEKCWGHHKSVRTEAMQFKPIQGSTVCNCPRLRETLFFFPLKHICKACPNTDNVSDCIVVTFAFFFNFIYFAHCYWTYW